MEQNISLIGWIAGAFTNGGIWMYAILAVHIVTVALIAERVFSLYFKMKKNQRQVLKAFEVDIKSGNLDKAFGKAVASSKTQPIGAVIAAGVEAAQDLGGRDEIQARMDEVLAVENSRIEKRTGFLSMLANVATLMGLLGTIIGLIQAFAAIANLGAAERSEVLTKGVSLAMNTTAYGLIVAIPALILFGVLTNRSNELQEDLNQSAFRAFNWLTYNYENAVTKIARPKRATK